MENLAPILFLFMGMTLGLTGSGGSILTLPILVYSAQLPLTLATTYSFFIVGTSAFIGVLRYKNSISFKHSLIFSIPSLSSVALTRYYLIPNLPKTLWTYTPSDLLMTLFIITMILASYLMITNPNKEPSPQNNSFPKVIALALFLGIIIGLLGTGGGFLIVPTLIMFLGIEIKYAIATSLFIIMLNSIVGFLSDPNLLSMHDYKSLLFFTGFSLAGMAFGLTIQSKVPNIHLKKGLGWFIAIIALSITLKELFL